KHFSQTAPSQGRSPKLRLTKVQFRKVSMTTECTPRALCKKENKKDITTKARRHEGRKEEED
ncbi:MAG: hypothetical protein COA78_33845, partial [Blastopirellula sp.]